MNILGNAPDVLADVLDELARAEWKFPDQHLPDGTNEFHSVLAEEAKRKTDDAARNGQLMWSDILREEFFEAMAETEWAKLRPELVQVAAMAVRWILDGDNRKENKGE